MRTVFLRVYYSSFTLYEFSTKHKISIILNMGIPANTLSKQLRATESGCSSVWILRGGKSLVQTQSTISRAASDFGQ
jgi:flagellar biosynthesis regulator FlaF